jgi:hypothetical protein
MVAKDITGIVVAIIVLAGLAVAVSSKSNTTSVLGAGFTGFGNLIGAATKPVTG